MKKIPIVRILDEREIDAARWALQNGVRSYEDMWDTPCELCPMGPSMSDKCLILSLQGDEGELHRFHICDFAELILGAYEKGKEDAEREK